MENKKIINIKLHKTNTDDIIPDFTLAYLREPEIKINSVEYCLNKTETNGNRNIDSAKTCLSSLANSMNEF